MSNNIEKKKYDYYNTDCNDPNMPYPVFLYWLADDLIGTNKDNLIPLTHSDKILSINYAPYVNTNELQLDEISYDIERFRLRTDKSVINISNSKKPKVYRIRSVFNPNPQKPSLINKRLGTFKCYSLTRPSTTNRHYLHESKLWQYPYRFAYLYDGIIQPIEIKYHLCKDVNNVEVWSRSALTINADYSLYLRNYKEDYDGFLEQSINNSNKELPAISNQYISWLATNKNQMQNRAMMNTLKGGFSGGMTGLATAGPIGAIGGALVGANVGYIQESISQNANNNDMKNLPNSLVSSGGDFILQMHTAGKELKLIRYIQHEEYLKRIGDYFAMFGYKQNKIMDLNSLIKCRYYYNYVKTVGVNIQCSGIPKEHLEELKSIFNNGVTIWHMSNNGVKMHDYSLDNKEV